MTAFNSNSVSDAGPLDPRPTAPESRPRRRIRWWRRSSGYEQAAQAQYFLVVAPPAVRSNADRARQAIAFHLFLLLNAVLIIRPSDLVADLENVRIYEALICLCLFVGLPDLLRQLTWQSLRSRPISLCVLLFGVAVVMSGISRNNFFEARANGQEFFKQVIYFGLLVGLVDTPARLRTFLWFVTVYFLVITALAVAQYHGALSIPALAAYDETQGEIIDPETGKPIIISRLCGPGIFHDPNEMSLMLLFGAVACLYWFDDRRGRPSRWFWFGSFAFFLHAVSLTGSRGGLLAMVAGGLSLAAGRLGAKKSIILAAILLPTMFVVYSGRQTMINVESGTAADRVRLWGESLNEFKGAPLFGIGMGALSERLGLLAHNSFVEAFADLGILGGTLFTCMFVYAVSSLYRLGKPGSRAATYELMRLRPYLLAVLVVYVVGYCSLSRNYSPMTYLVLGSTAAYLTIVPRPQRWAPRVLDYGLVAWGLGCSVAVLFSLYLFVRFTAHWSNA